MQSACWSVDGRLALDSVPMVVNRTQQLLSSLISSLTLVLYLAATQQHTP